MNQTWLQRYVASLLGDRRRAVKLGDLNYRAERSEDRRFRLHKGFDICDCVTTRLGCRVVGEVFNGTHELRRLLVLDRALGVKREQAVEKRGFL